MNSCPDCGRLSVNTGRCVACLSKRRAKATLSQERHNLRVLRRDVYRLRQVVAALCGTIADIIGDERAEKLINGLNKDLTL